MNTLASFSNVHAGGTILVCGCGQSLNQLERPEAKDNVVKFSLGTQGGTDFSNSDVLNYTQNSPYVALCLAIHMGARRIGLLGVDFTNDHFFGPTGVHSLTSQLTVIDQQYRRLGDAARARGVEIYNLSSESRLTAFPKITQAEFESTVGAALCGRPSLAQLHIGRPRRAAPTVNSPRVFTVNYNFLTCGDVFGTGLSNAGKQLGLQHEVALWDAPDLSARIERFRPDLIFVVHGRRFAEKWKGKFNSYKTAVWLVDEPYEVDDTTRWSSTFDSVFINDPNTLTRHPNAHYLPVCYDPVRHCDPGANRSKAVGFIGGYNETRNQYLALRPLLRVAGVE